MNQTRYRISLLLLCLGTLLVSTSGQDFRPYLCPTREAIAPCQCHTSPSGWGEVVISCSNSGPNGTGLTEGDVIRTMAELRLANNLSATDYIYVKEYTINRPAHLPSLDLSAFLHAEIDQLIIDGWHYFERISGPPLNVSAGLIKVGMFEIRNSLLTDEGFGDTFKYFNASHMDSIHLSYNKNITGTPDRNSSNMEFLPGMGAFSNLRYLSLQGNGIQKLQGGQFRGNNRLETMMLGNNDINTIGPDAFKMDPIPDGGTTRFRDLTIYLYYLNPLTNTSSLNSSSWDINHGLDTIEQGVDLIMYYDQMETIPQKVFKPFLEVRANNRVDFNGNPIFCDSKLKWLKDRAAEFRPKVIAYIVKMIGPSLFSIPLSLVK